MSPHDRQGGTAKQDRDSATLVIVAVIAITNLITAAAVWHYLRHVLGWLP